MKGGTDRRWTSPDPLGGDITNPQSLNRYAYALNNPTTLTDPSGLCPGCIPEDCSNPTYISAECPNPPGCVAEGIPAPMPKPEPAPPNAGGGIAGLPPGVADAFLGFHLICSQAAIGPPVNITNPAACAVYFLGLRLGSTQLIGSLAATAGVAGSFFVPLVPVGPAALGVNVVGATIPGSKTVCFGFGPGAAFPATKGLTLGPLLFGNLANTPSILSGWSFSTVAQPVPGRGVQIMGNSSGLLGGPTVGTVGSSVSFTVSGCHAF